jgi:hypothetical protein
MKKQLLIAAVAATMASVSMADISITGGAKINYTNVDSETAGSDSNTFKHDYDVTVAGTNGGTTTSMTVSNAVTTAKATNTGLTVENVFVASSIGDVNVKMGQWSGSDSLLGDGSRSSGKFSADTTVGGVKIQFEDQNDSLSSVTLSGSVAGAAISHEIWSNKTDSKISGTVAGVSMTYRTVDADAANSDKDSFEASYTTNGVTLTYAQMEVDGTGTTTSDAFFGTFATGSEIHDANGFSAKTDIAGNTITVKAYDVATTSTAADNSYTKVVVTRPMAAGATFEATYTDLDHTTAGSDSQTLDLELAVKF